MPKELKEDLFLNFINYIKPQVTIMVEKNIWPNDFSEDEDVNQRDEFITLIDDNEDIFPNINLI